MAKQEFRPGLYRHYKGGLYRALLLVHHHETEEALVVYVSLNPDHGKLRLRELDTPGKDSWLDEVEVDEMRVSRFMYVGP